MVQDLYSYDIKNPYYIYVKLSRLSRVRKCYFSPYLFYLGANLQRSGLQGEDPAKTHKHNIPIQRPMFSNQKGTGNGTVYRMQSQYCCSKSRFVHIDLPFN